MLYHKSQPESLISFLNQADGVSFKPMAMLEVEDISTLNLFQFLVDQTKVQSLLQRSLKDNEIAQTFSHIQCWQAVVNDTEIEDHQFVMISESNVQLAPNFSEPLYHMMHSIHHRYGFVILERQGENNIFSGEGQIGGVVFGDDKKAYNHAMSACYLVRKSAVKKTLEKYQSQKWYSPYYYFTEMIDVLDLAQANPLVGFRLKPLKQQGSDNLLFSIIVPVYNVENYLKECIESVLVQDFKHYELILVNDGSTDNSLKICAEYAQKYSANIKLISQANGGQSVARNTAMKNAQGEYLVFLDGDDYWEGNTILSDLAKIIDEKSPDLILHSAIYQHDDGKRVKFDTSINNFTGKFVQDVDSLMGNELYQSNAWSKVIKRTVLEDANITFPEGLIHEDTLFCFELLPLIDSYAIYPSHHYIYRLKRPESTTSVFNANNFNNIMYIFDMCYRQYEATDSSNPIKPAMNKYLQSLSYLSQYAKDVVDQNKSELGDKFDEFNQKMKLLMN